jgi:uncharacterized protein YggE
MIRPALALTAATAALALPAAAFAAPQVNLTPSGPVVELRVYETVEVAPDMATIGAGVSTTAPTAIAALRQNSVEMQNLVDRIKALGIPAEDIQTTGINLDAQYVYDKASQRSVFRGYQASNRVSVILRKLEEAGRVLDALVVAGATDLSGPAFGIADDTAATAEARTRALNRAMTQATAYAAMLGYQAARVIAITEAISGNGFVPAAPAAVGPLLSMASRASPVEPGMVSAGISVTVTFELTGNPATRGGK